MKQTATRVKTKPLTTAAQRKLQAEVNRLEKLTSDELLARSRSMTDAERAQWNRAKRGRPRKSDATRSVRVLFTIAPDLLAKVDRYAKAHDLTRAELIATGLRRAISA